MALWASAVTPSLRAGVGVTIRALVPEVSGFTSEVATSVGFIAACVPPTVPTGVAVFTDLGTIFQLPSGICASSVSLSSSS